MTDLSKLWDAALHQLITSPDIANLGHDDKMEDIIATLPYDTVAVLDVQTDINREELAMEIVKKFQVSGEDLVAAFLINTQSIESKIDRANLQKAQKEMLLQKMRKSHVDSLCTYYKSGGIHAETAIALAEAQIPK